MKRFLLGLSLLANVGLAAWIFTSPRSGTTANVESPGSSNPAEIAAWRAERDARAVAAKRRSLPANWSNLSADPREFFADLQAAGVPPRLARLLLQARLNESLEKRRRELISDIPIDPYYKNIFPPTRQFSAEVLSEIAAISSRNTKLLNELAGPDPGVGASNAEKMRFGSLPPEKVDQIKTILADYEEISGAIGAGSFGAPLPEDWARFAILNEERDRDIRAALSPEEYEEYLMRTSNSGITVRGNMALMNPTAEEFRTVFALQRQFDQVYFPFVVTLRTGNVTYGWNGDPRLAGDRIEAQKALVEQIKAALGPERGEEYARVSDPVYRNAAQLMTRLQLPAGNATELWKAQKEIQARATAIQRDASLDVAARRARLSTLRDEATQTATGLLGGQRGLDTYRNAGGAWIESLVPPVLR